MGFVTVVSEEARANHLGIPSMWRLDVAIAVGMILTYAAGVVLFLCNTRLYATSSVVGLRDSLRRIHEVPRDDLGIVYLCSARRWRNVSPKRFVTLVASSGRWVATVSVDEYDPSDLERWLAATGRAPQGGFDRLTTWDEARFGPWS